MKPTLFFIIWIFVQSAWAQESDYTSLVFDIPSIKNIRHSQTLRLPKVRMYKMKGYLGEHETGFLMVREPKRIKNDLKDVEKVIAEENKDRERLYNEWAKFNKLDIKKKKSMQRLYYELMRNTDAKGTYHFEGNDWQKKYD